MSSGARSDGRCAGPPGPVDAARWFSTKRPPLRSFVEKPVDAGTPGPLPSGIRTGADARVTLSARGSGRPGREPDGRRKTDAQPTVRDDADAGSGAARWDGTRTTGGVSWTDCVSRSRRASRTPLSSRPRTPLPLEAGLDALALTLSPDGAVGHRRSRAPAAGLDRGDQPDRDPRAGRGRHSPRRRQPEWRRRPARARHRPVHRPGVGRRLPGPPDRRGPAGRPCAPARAGGQEGGLPVGRGERDGTRRTPSRRRLSAPRRWPPIAAIAVAGRG